MAWLLIPCFSGSTSTASSGWTLLSWAALTASFSTTPSTNVSTRRRDLRIGNHSYSIFPSCVNHFCRTIPLAFGKCFARKAICFEHCDFVYQLLEKVIFNCLDETILFLNSKRSFLLSETARNWICFCTKNIVVTQVVTLWILRQFIFSQYDHFQQMIIKFDEITPVI